MVKKFILYLLIVACMFTFTVTTSAKGTELSVEGENYTRQTGNFVINDSISGTSGGKYIQLWSTANGPHSVSYDVEVPKAGSYTMDLYSTEASLPVYHSPFEMSVNGVVYPVTKSGDFSGQIRHNTAQVVLEEGVNTVEFTITAKRTMDNVWLFFMDRFVLSYNEIIKGAAISGGDYTGENLGKEGVTCDDRLVVSADAPEGSYTFDYNVIVPSMGGYNIKIVSEGMQERGFVSVNGSEAEKPALADDGSYNIFAKLESGINKISYILDSTPTEFVLDKFRVERQDSIITVENKDFAETGETTVATYRTGSYSMTFKAALNESTLCINDIPYTLNEDLCSVNDDGSYTYKANVMLKSGDNSFRIDGDYSACESFSFTFKDSSSSVRLESETQPPENSEIKESSPASEGKFVYYRTKQPLEFTQYFTAPTDGSYTLTTVIPRFSNTPRYFSPVNISINGGEYIPVLSGNVSSMGEFWFWGVSYSEKIKLRKSFALKQGVNTVSFKLDTKTTEDQEYFSWFDYCLFEPQSSTDEFTDVFFNADNVLLKKGDTLNTLTSVFNDGFPVLFDGDITYSSDNANVATIDEDGVVSAHNTGVAKIKATAISNGSSMSKSMNIYVYNGENAVAILNAEKISGGIKVDVAGMSEDTAENTELIVAAFDKENGILSNVKSYTAETLNITSPYLLQSKYFKIENAESKDIKVFVWSKSPQKPVFCAVDVK